MVEHPFRHAGQSEQALKLLIASVRSDCALLCCEVYACVARRMRHSSGWERAYQQHESDLASIEYDPLMSSVRGDLRYAALLRKMKLSAMTRLPDSPRPTCGRQGPRAR